MNESIFILDEPITLRAALSNLLEINGFKVQVFEKSDALTDSLKLKVPSILLLNIKSLNTKEVKELLEFNNTLVPRPIIVAYAEHDIHVSEQDRILSSGFDGCLSSVKEDGFILSYLQSLLKIRDDLAETYNDQLKYQMLFETMFSAYALHEIIVDKNGEPINYRYLEVNPAFEKITGLKASKVVGKTLFEVFPNAQKHVVETYGAVALKDAKLQFEQFSVEHNKYFEIIAFSPKKRQFSTIFTDITAYKKALQAVKESEAKLKELNETKDKFFSVISHDLKNPFHNIMGFVELFYNDYNDYSEDEKFSLLEQIKNSTESVYALLVNLLEWSKLQQNKITAYPADVNLQDLAKQEIEGLLSLAESKGIRLINDIDEQAMAFADSNMVKTVFRNLISNAIKFSHENSEVIIGGTTMPKYYNVFVEDRGVGIDENRLENLFKLNFQKSTLGTAKEKGTGLGLNLCKEFVEKNNGKIWAESKIGVGSRFSFLLPLNEK